MLRQVNTKNPIGIKNRKIYVTWACINKFFLNTRQSARKVHEKKKGVLTSIS